MGKKLPFIGDLFKPVILQTVLSAGASAALAPVVTGMIQKYLWPTMPVAWKPLFNVLSGGLLGFASSKINFTKKYAVGIMMGPAIAEIASAVKTYLLPMIGLSGYGDYVALPPGYGDYMALPPGYGNQAMIEAGVLGNQAMIEAGVLGQDPASYFEANRTF
ncbi:MAG: hypothetical protein KKD44_29440 [Proteobacteria bacterium]|nr:hypothetical protein [Pseudomonadota bacterium]